MSTSKLVKPVYGRYHQRVVVRTYDSLERGDQVIQRGGAVRWRRSPLYSRGHSRHVVGLAPGSHALSSSSVWAVTAVLPWCPLALRHWLRYARPPGSGGACHRGHSPPARPGAWRTAKKIPNGQKNKGFAEKCSDSILRNRAVEGICQVGAVCRDRRKSIGDDGPNAWRRSATCLRR